MSKIDLSSQVKNKLPKSSGGVPAGGTANQVLTKIDSQDNNVSWGTVGLYLTNWTESNYFYNTRYGVKFATNLAQTNVDIVLQPKGTGGISAQQPDGTPVGGNRRGDNAIDLSTSRSTATQVASGSNAFNSGASGTASGSNSFNSGNLGAAIGTSSFNSGASGTANGPNAFNSGASGTANAISPFNSGASGTVTGAYSFNSGYSGTVSGNYSFNSGNFGTVTGSFSFNSGNFGTATGTYSFNSGNYGEAFVYGENTHSSGRFITLGDAQRRELILRGQSSDVSPTVVLTSDSNLAGSINQLVLRNNQSITAQVLVVAKKTGTTNSTAHFILTVCASRGTTAASIILHTTPTVQPLWNPDGVSLTAAVDSTNGAISFSVTTPAGNWNTVIQVLAISTIYA